MRRRNGLRKEVIAACWQSGRLMAALRFGVLGPLEVSRDNESVPVPTGRRRAVLACLLVHARHPVAADVLIEAGWGDDLPRDPRASLNTVLSRLRAVLGSHTVRAEPPGYRLDVPADAIDAQEFEELLGQAESAAPMEVARLLGRALELWRGPAYGEFSDREFASVEAQRLERLRLDAIGARAEAAIDSGDTETAISSLEALLAEHPYREHAVELLLTALYRAGRQTEALDRYRDYRSRLVDELGLEPSPSLRDLEARILGHAVVASGTPAASDLPSWLDTSTAFIGRDDTTAELVDALLANRVVTVTGVGGVGKSRLAAEVLAPVAERLRLPVTLVELVSVSPGRATSAIADALGLSFESAPAVPDVVERLSATRTVVVLDNCEHLLNEVSPLVDAMAHRCPGIHVLATSRHRLGVPSELVLPLEPLAVPSPDADVERQRLSPAMRLLADRIRRLRPFSGINAGNARDAADVCRRLDGLPLALELAASRAAAVGLSEVRGRLWTDLIEPSSGNLSAVVEWSYRLLTEEQRRLLDMLSVFVGDFDPGEVQAVARYLDPRKGEVAQALAALVEASLLSGRDHRGQLRYRLFGIVRTFAARRLTESGAATDAHLAHAMWARDVTQEVAGDWPRCDGANLGERLDQRRDEITAALEWTLRFDQLGLAADIAGAVMACLHWTPDTALSELITEVAERVAQAPDPALAHGVAAGAFFAAERGDLQRARRLAHAALDMTEPPEQPVHAWLALGVAAFYAGDHAEASSCFHQLAESPELMGEANTSLALLACYADDLPAAREHITLALAAGPSGSDASHAFARYAAGEVEARTSPERGAALLSQAAAEGDRVAARQVSRVARVALFALLVRAGRHDEAAELGTRLLHDLRRIGAWPQLWTTLRMSAELLAATGNHADAAILLAAADAAVSAPPLVGDDMDRYADLFTQLRDHIADAVVDRLLEFAVSLSRTQIADRATVLLGGLVSTRDSGAPEPP